MAELGYDLTRHASKTLDDIAALSFDAVITVSCGDACPHVPAKIREDWQIPDPRDMDDAEFRAVRGLIRERVLNLLERIGA